MKKVAFFDFCETLVNFQTADAFVDFVRLKSKRKGMMFIERLHQLLRRTKIIAVLDKLTGGKQSINKRVKLLQLRGISRIELDKFADAYYEESLKPNFITSLLDKLRSLQRQGWEIVIVSGGYDVYLNYFVQEYRIQRLISTKIKFKGDKCQGTIDGDDCMRENKIKVLNQLYNREEIRSISFSDSKSDIPFLSWTNEGVVVSHKEHKEWADNLKLKEIIWD